MPALARPGRAGKAPNGYGTDLIYFRGLFIGDGDGDNFINTVIDDASSNDLNLSGSADAPYTNDWLPAFNSPIWSLFGIPNLGPDPVGQLSRVNGLSTQGNWQVHVTDEAEGDTGTLNTWSLIVTPKAFSCVAFVPTVAVTGTKTVAGTFNVGGTVTYTVVLANSGTVAQADNPGNEFTDVLPSGLIALALALALAALVMVRSLPPSPRPPAGGFSFAQPPRKSESDSHPACEILPRERTTVYGCGIKSISVG